MNHGQELIGHVRIATLGDGVMVISSGLQSDIASPIIGDDQRIRRDCAFHEAAKRISAPVGSYSQSNPPGITPIPSIVLRGTGLAVPDLYGGCYQRLVMDTPAFSTGSATNPDFVDLDVIVRDPADPVLVGTHHGGTQLVEQAECRFISA